MMRILFTSPIMEFPAAGGPQLRIANSIKALSSLGDLYIVHQADFASDESRVTREYFKTFSKSYATYYKFPKSKVTRFLLKCLDRIFPMADKRIGKRITNLVRANSIDIVWAGYGNLSYPVITEVKKSLPDIKIICDTDSVYSRFILREIPYAKRIRRIGIRRAGKRKEIEERSWVNLCDVTTAVSEVDAAYYRSIARNPDRVHLFSNVIDLDNYEVIPERPAWYRSPSLVLTGWYGPNSAMNLAASWVISEVLPRVRSRHPGLHFYLVGRNSDSEFGHLAGPDITVTGRVESVLPYLGHASVSLVPLMFESGTRFKILEAGACNVPVVSTTLGAEGLAMKHTEHILIADEPDEFAEAILRILDNPAFGAKMARRCKAVVSEGHSIRALVSEAQQIFKYLAND